MYRHEYSIELDKKSNKVFLYPEDTPITNIITQYLDDIELFILANTWYGLNDSGKIELIPQKINDEEWHFYRYNSNDPYTKIKIIHKKLRVCYVDISNDH